MTRLSALCKIPKFNLLFWCGNFLKTQCVTRKSVLPQNLHTRKLGKIIVLCSVKQLFPYYAYLLVVSVVFLISYSFNSSITKASTTTSTATTSTPPPPATCKKYEKEFDYVDSSRCISVAPVTKSYCFGGCNSSVTLDFDRGMIINKCICCRPDRMKKVQTQLRCLDGSKKTFSYLTIEKCLCRQCDSSAFTDVPFLKSASPYKSLRFA